MAEDYYKILDVPKSANADELKKAYRKMALQYHPDRNQGDKAAEERFKQVNEAYETLSDPQKKRMYDQLGHDSYKGSGAGNPGGAGGYGRGSGGGFEDIFGGFEDIFDSFFGGGNRSRGGGAKRQAQGDNLLVRLSVTLREAFNGTQKTIVINRDEECVTCHGRGTEKEGDVVTCPQCNGKGEVIIRQGFFSIRQTCPQCEGTGVIVRNPCRTCGGRGIQNQKRELVVNILAGVETGNRLTLQGEGNAIKRGTRGNIYLDIEVKPEPGVKREGRDLFYTKEVPFTIMVLGGEVSILNLEDKEVTIKIPAGTPNSQTFKIKGQGMPVVSFPSKKGDLYITVDTSIPKKLSQHAKNLLLELDKELSGQ